MYLGNVSHIFCANKNETLATLIFRMYCENISQIFSASKNESLAVLTFGTYVLWKCKQHSSGV